VKPIALWRVSVPITPEAEEAVVPLFEDLLGQLPSIYTDAETGAVTATVFLRKAPQKRILQAEVRAAFRRLKPCGLDPGTGRLSVTRVRKQDWSESWKRHFKPFAVNGQLLVKPSWSGRKPARGQQVVVIDPGLSFGTGQHPTTRFCLEHTAQSRVPGERQSLLDVGTGSGILAIAAAKLGYRPVRSFDFDPAAVRVARENAHRNGVQIGVTRGDIRKRRERARYDVVCANLTADLLEMCAAKLKGWVKPGGALILAGILRTQSDSVRKCFEKRGLAVVARAAEGEWESLLLRTPR
jgi:ribosomal protein L11 methyltransferase